MRPLTYDVQLWYGQSTAGLLAPLPCISVDIVRERKAKVPDQQFRPRFFSRRWTGSWRRFPRPALGSPFERDRATLKPAHRTIAVQIVADNTLKTIDVETAGLELAILPLLEAAHTRSRSRLPHTYSS